MVKRTWEASRGRRLDVGFARWPEVPRTQSSHPVFARREAPEGIRALAGVAALALRPVHTCAVAAARLGAGSAKAGWAWRRWRVWRRRCKRRLRKVGLREGSRARNGPRRQCRLIGPRRGGRRAARGRGGEGGALRAVRTDDHCPL
ncbi:hypothetical protein GUJ93_ZPchr0012g21562 [Zizania palustris]|uniref:Uncharacterized protein n=1 Tax=Zizania palustris TaxID=103762 RepID=A0A8J6BWC3_ZIZPA|nr:hypothetical protein GUJ93_ZPchr0012g21562 [Zizania palustris]